MIDFDVVRQSRRGNRQMYLSEWVVENVETFYPDWADDKIKKPTRLFVHLNEKWGLTFEEWYQIFVNVIKIEEIFPREKIMKTGISLSMQHPEWIGMEWIDGFTGDIPNYPVLSKLNGDFYEDLSFSKEEVSKLRQECLELRQTTENKIALSGLNKLINLCEEAEKDNLAVYFMSK